MAVGAGVALIAAGALGSLLVLFAAWRRLSAPLAFGLLVLGGAAIGAGGLLVQDEASVGSWVITMGLLGGLSPLHGRLVFGPPGSAD
jgi:hypothetical protein